MVADEAGPDPDGAARPVLQYENRMLLSEVRRGRRGGGHGGENVNPWWWVPIGLAAWFLVGLAVALCLGPVLRRSSHTWETLDREPGEKSDGREPPRDRRRAS